MAASLVHLLQIVTVVFSMPGGHFGLDTEMLAEGMDCDQKAALMIEQDVKDFPQAEDFAWHCSQFRTEGYPPSQFDPKTPYPDGPPPSLPGGHPDIDAIIKGLEDAMKNSAPVDKGI